MKGIIFTELIEMTESTFGDEIAERMIMESGTHSNGVYTAVGTYEFAELGALVHSLSQITHMDLPTLLRAFGRHLFGSFLRLYPAYFQRCQTSFEFLSSIEDHIHVQVRKLYPDAELPHFQTSVNEEKNHMIMTYTSARNLADLACGLIESTLQHYNENGTITRMHDTGNESVIFHIDLL